MNQKLITKKDYEILGIKKNATSKEISVAYEKLLQEYHPEKIKLEKFREPTEVEIEKYKEIDDTFKKFVDNSRLEVIKFKCSGWKGDRGSCTNIFYPCLWKKIENGHEHFYCSQECYNSKLEFSWDDKEREKKIDEINRKLEEFKQQKFQERKVEFEQAKSKKIEFLLKKLEQAKVKPEELEPNNRNFEQEINSVTFQNADDNGGIIRLSDISDRIEKDIYSKKKGNKIYCDNCGEEIEQWREPGTNHTFAGIGSVDSNGNRGTFCSQECCDKGMKGKGKWVVRKSTNPFTELLKWMEKEGIDNISVSNGKLALTYSNKQEKTIEDENLTDEQKEIKNFFQTIGKNSLSRDQARAEVEKDKNKGGKSWLGPVIGIGIVALIVIFIGIIIYKNKKKGY